MTQKDAIKTLYPVYSKNTAKPVTEEEFRNRIADPQKRKVLYNGFSNLGYADRLGTYEQFEKWLDESQQNPANVPIQELQRPGITDAQPVSTNAQAQPQNNAHAQSYAQQTPPTANGENAQDILRTGIAQGLKQHDEKQDALLQTKEEGLQLQQMYDLFSKENEDAIFLAKTKRATAAVPGMVMPGAAYDPKEADVIKQRNTLQSALELNEKTQKILAAPSRFDDSNAFANFGKGVESKATDIDFWTFGITNIARNLNTRDVAMKLQKAQDQYGEDVDIDTILTEPEKALLGAFFNNLHASALRADDLSLGYQAGQGAMDSAKFMAEFILTGGISKAATKGATKALESWIVKNIASKAGRTLAKGGLAVAKGLVGTAARTPVMLSTYSNITDQAVLYDENGRLKNGFKAVGLGFLDSFIENLSETMGEHIIAGMKLPFTSLISKIPETGFTKFFQNLSKTGAYKLMKQGGWNGFAGEYFEEWYGNSLRALTGNKEALQDFATIEQQLITLASFAPITILGGAVSTAQYVSAEKNFQNATLALKDILKDNGYKTSQVEYIMDLIMDTTPSQMAQKVAPIINQMALETEGDAGNLLTGISEFIRTKSIMQGYDGIYEAEHQEKRNELDQDLQNEIGEYTNKKGEVEMAVDKDGNANYVLSDVADELEPLIVVKGLDGQTKMVSKSEYEANYTPSVLTSKDEYLSEMIMTKQTQELAEETKIEEDANFLNSIELGVPQYFNINGVMTEGTPQAITPDGSITVHFGNHVEMLTADQYKALNQPTAVTATQTEELAQAEQEQAAQEQEAQEQAEQEQENLTQEQAQPVQEEQQPLAPEQVAQEQTTEAQETPRGLPKTADGETDFDALLDADPETYAQELAKAIGEERAANTMSALAKQTDAQIEKLQKRLEKETSTNKIVSINRNIDQLQQRRDALTGLIVKGSKPQTPQTPEVTDGQTAQPVQAGQVGQNIADNWNNTPKQQGIEESFTLPNGKQIKGRWILTEAGAATPSHDPHTLQPSEGFPVTKDGKNVNDNDYTKKAAEVETMAQSYDSRAIDHPIFVKNGIVVSGNNRTMSGILAAERGTDTKYREALAEKAKKMGFSPEQIAQFENPRLYVEISEDLPLNTETFALFNQRETKSKTPTERAIVVSKRDNTRVIGLISRELDGYERLSDLYQNEGASTAIAKYLTEGGLINQNELPELFENGSFTPAGKDFLESVLVGSVMKEDQVKILATEGMRSTRQRVVKAIVPLIENSKLREEGRIIDDINTGIKYLYGAKKAGMTLREYFLQSNMFEAATYDLNGVRNALMLQGTEKDFRDYVQLANKRLKDPIANMFTGEMETKDDVYQELENQYNDEQRRTIEAARAANAQSGAAGNDQGAVLPGDPKDNEPGGPGISADAGEQTEASPATNEGSGLEVDTQPTHSEQKEDPGQEQSDQGLVSVFDAAKKAEESEEVKADKQALTEKIDNIFASLSDLAPHNEQLWANTSISRWQANKFLKDIREFQDAAITNGNIDYQEDLDNHNYEMIEGKEVKINIYKLNGYTIELGYDGSLSTHGASGIYTQVENPQGEVLKIYVPKYKTERTTDISYRHPRFIKKQAETKPEESSGVVSVFAAAEKAKEKPRQEKNEAKNRQDGKGIIPQKISKPKMPKTKEEYCRTLASMVSNDPMRPVVTGVLFDADNKMIVATDAMKLIAIPSSLPKTTEIIGASKRKSSGVEFGQLLKGQYPNYKGVIPLSSSERFEGRFNIELLLGQALTMLKEANERIKQLDKPTDQEKDHERILKFGIHYVDAKVLSDVLRALYDTGTKHIVVEYSRKDRPLVFRDERDMSKVGLVMPMYIPEEGEDNFEERFRNIPVLVNRNTIAINKEPGSKKEKNESEKDDSAMNPDNSPVAEEEEKADKQAGTKAAEVIDPSIKPKKGDKIAFEIGGREVKFEYDSFISDKNGTLTYDYFGMKTLKPGEYRIERGGNVINVKQGNGPNTKLALTEERDVPEKIEDFGEKIEGAKKDIWQKNDATSEDIKSLPLSKIFPRPDFPQLVKDGKLPVESALLLRYLYDTIPPKPRKEYKLKTWVSGVKGVIDAMNTLIDNPSYHEQIMSKMGLLLPSYHNSITTYIALHKELGFPETDLNTGKYEVKRFDGRGYSIINGPYIISDHETLAEAAAALKRRIEQNRKKLSNGEVKLSIYQDTRTKKYFIGRKGATGIVRLVDNIEKLADAKTMFRDQQVQLQEMWRQLKVKPEERRSSNRERIGVDYRKGKNITPETFSETFGFRGVQFGNWVNNDERQDSLNEAFDALMDLSTTLGISGRALSLNGELGIAFGARGSGKYNAHYEPGQVVINLTKTKGAGSLAHEWWHALDNYFSRMKGEGSKYFTESPRQKILNTGEKDQSVRKEMVDSFKALVSAINKSGLPERSKNLDKARSVPYWSTIIEMSARSFENYIIEKLAANEGSNDYLANFKEIGEWAERGLSENNYPYPTKDETEVINPAFQDLFDTIQEKVDQETGNVMLFRSVEEQPDSIETELDQIKQKAIADGTFMKAPNGKPTNLTERQWLQVRTKAFKEWFGDWLKAYRIDKLRKSRPVEITGEEYKGKYELNRDSVKAYLKDHLRKEYKNKDTGEIILVAREGSQKVTSHGMGNDAHLKSIIAIPKLIEDSIFIDELPNEKGNNTYDSYRYYVAGLKIDGEDYAVKIVIGVDKHGNKYYDHALTEIEKTKLIDYLNQSAKGFTTTGDVPIPSSAKVKDTKLLSILQNSSSKVVDENWEPLMVYHGTNAEFNEFRGNHGQVMFSPSRKYAQIMAGDGKVMEAYLNIERPFEEMDLDFFEWAGDYEEYVEELKTRGYDGAISADNGEQISVFNPNQIKSATDNMGTFDAGNEDIRFRMAEDIDNATEFLESDKTDTYTELTEDEIPENTQEAYKLMRYFNNKPGILYPLYAKDEAGKKGFKKGTWYKAEKQSVRIGGKDLANRPGIHAVDLPLFLQGKVNKNGETRVWVRVQMPAMDEKTQSENDNTPLLPNGQRAGIRERLIGPKEAYNFKTNPTATGANAWPIAGSMKILEVIPDSEVERILAENGKEEYIELSKTGDPDIKFRKNDQAGFYSTVEDALGRLPQEKGTPDQTKAMLLKNGAKEAEMDWIGWDDHFKGKSVTKAEIQDWVDQNRIEVEEVQKGANESATTLEINQNDKGEYYVYDLARAKKVTPYYKTWQEAAYYLGTHKPKESQVTKYSQYTVPGGSNYRELLLTMPEKKINVSYSIIDDYVNYGGNYKVKNDVTGEVMLGSFKTKEAAQEWIQKMSGERYSVKDNFKSSHFDEPNILAHVRFNERTMPNGEKVLFIEEIQSDWAQEGKKKGFSISKLNPERFEIKAYRDRFVVVDKTKPSYLQEIAFGDTRKEAEEKAIEITNLYQPAVPNMPFKQTSQWVNLALRRMMRYAAENGFDRIAWTNGEQQAERYDLSKQVYKVKATNEKGSKKSYGWDLWVTDSNKNVHHFTPVDDADLVSVVGKELAEKIINDNPNRWDEKEYSGLDLKVGGEGMKAFYNNIVPKAANKLGKPFGAKIEEVQLPLVAKGAYNEQTEELELSVQAEEIQDRFMESQAEEGDYALEDYVKDMKDAGYEVLFEDGEPVNLKKITAGQTFTVQSLPVTYAMKESVPGGMPLFRPFMKSPMRERIIARDRLESMVDKLNIKVNIVNLKDVKDQRQRNSKGFYNPRTGEITIVLDNHKTADDAIATLLHEAVAHKGLRNLFGAEINRFLDSVYQNADKEVRTEINKLIAKNGWDTRLATEEYLATLAESTNYNESESLWRKIKNFFMDMLRRAGIKMDGVLTDADLRYILQRSHDRLTDPSGPGGVFDAARDAQIRRRVGLNSDNETRFRSKKNAAQDKVEQFANNAYDARLNETINKVREAHQDSMLSLKILQEEVAKASGKEIQTFEDAYLAENHISSKNLYEKEHFMANYYEPMSKAIRSLADKLDGEYQSVVTYAMAKHGLERNLKLAERDTEKMHAKWKAELDKKLAQDLIDQAKYDKEIKRLEAKYDETVAYFRGRDYSGLTALFPSSESMEELPDVALAEAMAQELVDQVEEAAPEEVQEFWSRVNAATKKSLYKTYETGILTRSVYENIRDMYDYYIPLRGFSETTADDVYEYLQFDRSSFSPPVLTARGRKSIAEDPFATIGTMAESAIQQGNNNWMKQKFLNMALNHESDLISVREMWYENKGAEENPDWVQAMPDIAPGANAMEVNQAYETFEQRMADLSGIGMAKKSMKGLNIPYRTLGKQAQEHSVIVKSAGKEYVIFINGNPRAAQAINGLTNPDVSDTRKKIMRANRWLAANYTTRSPKFMLRNLSRDTIYSLFNIYVKEDKAYNRKFRGNLVRNYGNIWKMMRDYSQNKLDTTTEKGMYMQEFLANGGETGYTVLKRVDEYKRIMNDLMKQAKGGKVVTLKKALRYVFDQIGFANRCIEDICRFTAFTTSRQMGRSVEESIADAKNVSVNFNKKGSGKGYGASTLRTAYLFYNAGVQGLDNFAGLYKKNPRKFTIGTASMLAAGALMPFFNQLIAMALGGDPDEYLDMPEWIRRNNLVIGGNGFYITIPLPIELRAIYGIGDIAYMASAGRMKNKNIAGEILGQLTDIMPVDPVGNNAGVANLVPDIVSPLFENLINEDFTGRPIFRNNSFNRYYPAFTKAYAGTNKALVRASELINRIGGGDDVTKGWVENNITIADVNNPAKWEHIFEGYFGGALTTANEAAKTLSMIWDPDQRILRNVPLANVLLQHNDERTSNSFVNDMYYYYKEEYDKVKQSIVKYGQDPEKYSKQQRSLENKDRHKRYLVFEEHLDEMKNVEKELKEAPDDDTKRDLNAYYNRLKGRLVDELMKRD